MEFNSVNKKYSNYQLGKWVWPLQIRNLTSIVNGCLRYASWRKWIFLRGAAVSAKSAVSAIFYNLSWFCREVPLFWCARAHVPLFDRRFQNVVAKGRPNASAPGSLSTASALYFWKRGFFFILSGQLRIVVSGNVNPRIMPHPHFFKFR